MLKFVKNLLLGFALCGAAFLYVFVILYMSFKSGALVAEVLGSDGFGFVAMIGFGTSLGGGTLIAIKEVMS